MILEAVTCPDCGELSVRSIHIDERGAPFWACKKCGVIHEDRSWYRYISQKLALGHHRNPEADWQVRPRYRIEVIGIDNETGDAWTEEFPDMQECLAWLCGDKKWGGTMCEKKKQSYDVYLLDMYLDECGWTENERHLLGKLDIELTVGTEIDDVDVLTALKNFSYRDLTGRSISALVTTDRRTVYAEDYYGDGSWWEVGAVRNGFPCTA